MYASSSLYGLSDMRRCLAIEECPVVMLTGWVSMMAIVCLR